jgi:hypothetical protein
MRPDWMAVYAGTHHDSGRDGELVTVTRETARLALAALDRKNGQDAYHNYMAAAGGLRAVLE